MSKNYHAEVLDVSLKNRKMLQDYPVIDVRKRFLGLLKIYTISVPEEEIQAVVKRFQENLGTALKKEWYITFHTNEKAFVVFREKMFSMSTKGIEPVHYQRLDTSHAEDQKTWDEVIACAKSLGVPDDQCDFLPDDYVNQKYDG